MQINIKKMHISGFEVAIPKGLSELINSSNAWSTISGNINVKGYERKVYMKNGRLVTELIKKTKSS